MEASWFSILLLHIKISSFCKAKLTLPVAAPIRLIWSGIGPYALPNSTGVCMSRDKAQAAERKYVFFHKYLISKKFKKPLCIAQRWRKSACTFYSADDQHMLGT